MEKLGFGNTNGGTTFEAVQENQNNGANYAPAEIPTPENSKRKTDSSQISSGMSSPDKPGDACC